MAKAAEKTVSKGDEVLIVLADKKKAKALVTRVAGKDLVDVEFEHGGVLVTITSSPLDASGLRPDSWHLEEKAGKEEKTEAPKA